jgi:hypothetical protein
MRDCQNRRPLGRVVDVTLSSQWPASEASALRELGTPCGRAEIGPIPDKCFRADHHQRSSGKKPHACGALHTFVGI